MGAENRIEVLKQKRAQLDAEIQRLAARNRMQSRKDDTRRKILIGAVVMLEMADHEEFARFIRKALSKRLMKPRDRQLFNLDASNLR
ncbi:MAG: hypothetical protein JST30_07715 [Armatimonadetes bacterium]|nr:hypothetical protein [Armatimonadota bacterium]